MGSDNEDALQTMFTDISKQQVPVETMEDSQCETVCDEDMTEEEYDLNATEHDDAEEDDDENIGDDSSTCTARNSDDTDDETSQSYPALEIQDLNVQFPEISEHFQILSKIGEGKNFHLQPPNLRLGTFSSVYKAVDLKYDLYANTWDPSWKQARKWSSPPIKRRGFEIKRPAKYVALKRIYVTSSPTRILNELALLHHLKGCDKVVSLITAFRKEDQIIAVLPYFKHVEFRDYYRTLSLNNIRLYFRSLFTALDHVHSRGILHRDIKPSNFLFDVSTRQGVLVDFGLAEYQDPSDAARCPCSSTTTREKQRHSAHEQRLTLSTPLEEGPGYHKHDQRPAKRANRAGTRGFRAPEVLFKCQSQSTKIDIWSCGVILLSFLAKRFPFFNSADDIDAMIELASIYGKASMKACAELHNCSFDTTLPTLSEKPMTFFKIVEWAMPNVPPLDREQKMAFEFLDLCMELNPQKRASAAQALQHPFLSAAEEDEGLEDVFLT